MQANNIKSLHYDVAIIGGGIAGLSCARHLLLKIPELRHKRVAIIEPRCSNRNNSAEDYKVGESTVDVSSMFFAKELELQDYMLENQPPKFNLQFHWPKDMSETESMDDYYSIWAIKNPEIQTFQMNRSKMERDLLQMVQKQGVVYYHGRVKEVEIGKGNSVKVIDIQLLSDEDKFEDQKPLGMVSITADYIADASGRNFIIGSRTNNVLKDPKDLFGLQNASTWLRVVNADKTIFECENSQVTASWYYATNHFFGDGYWIWMIPIERNSGDISIGVSYHRDKYEPSQFNTLDKFMSFLQTNQTILYNLIKSGEVVDFHRWPKIAHTSKTFYSEDNWAVLGDAAVIFDPFYSAGMVMISLQIECLTELIKHRLAGDMEAVNIRRVAYDKQMRSITQTVNHTIKKHSDHLGNASIMSWRIFFETMNYFGGLLPIYMGKYHLCPVFANEFSDNNHYVLEFHDRLLNILDYVNEKGINIGFMDNHRGGQIFGDWCPTTTWDYDNALSYCMYGHKRLNLPKYIYWTHFYQTICVLKLCYRALGSAMLLNSDFLWMVQYDMKAMAFFGVKSWWHSLTHIGTPTSNDYHDRFLKEFKDYKYKGGSITWKDS